MTPIEQSLKRLDEAKLVAVDIHFAAHADGWSWRAVITTTFEGDDGCLRDFSCPGDTPEEAVENSVRAYERWRDESARPDPWYKAALAHAARSSWKLVPGGKA